MTESIRERILAALRDPHYRPLKRRALARNLQLDGDGDYPLFKEAVADLEDEGVIAADGPGNGLALCARQLKPGEVIGVYSGSKRGFGFLDVREPVGHPQLFVAAENNQQMAVTGDVCRARVVDRDGREAGDLKGGRIVAIVKRAHARLVGTLQKTHTGTWQVLPDGNLFKQPILTPDAAGKYLAPGTKVVVEITTYPTEYEQGTGVVGEVLGQRGEKDVDLRAVLIQHNLPEDFPDAVKEQARQSVARFDPQTEKTRRLDLTGEVVATIDPDDAKDYDDAISLRRDADGNWLLGVHIADVSYFVEQGSPLDQEAQHRGNSVYFPGHVVPMLPEVLSNGVCSLQEGVQRLVKSALITIDARTGQPLRTAFANAVIHSRKRFRYREAQALIDGLDVVPHPDGDRRRSDYDRETLALLDDMNTVAKLIQKRRQAAGQLVLDLPKVDLVLNETGKIVDARPEDDAFTHTLIEMFMVEANEAVARLFDRLDVPFIRRIHPDPDPDAAARLNKFVMVAGHKVPTEPTRQDLQKLLAGIKGKPEGFAVNLAVLKSLARAEYSPEPVGHYALASKHYCHFTSPIRRYADLTVHRLLDATFAAIGRSSATLQDILAALDRKDSATPAPTRGTKGDEPHEPRRGPALRDAPSYQELIQLGQHLSFTERKADAAEKELRQVKLLELMSTHVGEDFTGVVTGIVKFGLFIQLEKWLVEGLVRYPELLNDFWEVDEKAGVVRGKRTGQRIHIGDVARVRVSNVDVARRELNVSVQSIESRGSKGKPLPERPQRPKVKGDKAPSAAKLAGGEVVGGKRRPPKTGTEKRSQRSRSRDARKTDRRREK